MGGETISKQFLDRYAQFSKAAHFQLGGTGKAMKVIVLFLHFVTQSDGSKTSATKALFTNKPIDNSNKGVTAANCEFSRNSHFSVGKHDQSHPSLICPDNYQISRCLERVKPDACSLQGEQPSWSRENKAN